MLTNEHIWNFVTESNKIEAITRPPTEGELSVTEWFIHEGNWSVDHIAQFVQVCQPGARIRQFPNMNVQVGNHVPPRGGPEILKELLSLLSDIEKGVLTPYEAHVRYETIHPFMDGNGRSGRAVWAKHMLEWGQDGFWPERGFLHTFYYQSLDTSR